MQFVSYVQFVSYLPLHVKIEVRPTAECIVKI